MRTFRVHLDELREGTVRVSGSAAHHLVHVLRCRPGFSVVAFDGHGLEAEGTISAVEPTHVELELAAPRPGQNEAALAVTLAPALLKGDKLRDVVRQATELGATAFRPFVSRRADVRELSPARLERLRRVASEAARQSGRAVVPDVHAALSTAALAQALAGEAVIYADPLADLTLREAVPRDASALTILTGPEGGFAEEEITLFREAGFLGVQLGTRILRAETAPPALLAALLLPDAL